MGTKIKHYAILTHSARPRSWRESRRSKKLDVDVVETQSGALVVRELPVPQLPTAWDIRNILGPDESDFDEHR